jgi:hypothetical protein
MEVGALLFPFPAVFKWGWDTSGNYFKKIDRPNKTGRE